MPRAQRPLPALPLPVEAAGEELRHGRLAPDAVRPGGGGVEVVLGETRPVTGVGGWYVLLGVVSGVVEGG